MAFQNKYARSMHPQIITVIVDDSVSMQGTKAKEATEAVQDFLITVQAKNMGASRGSRYLLNIAKFGCDVIQVAVAKRPEDVDITQVVFEGKSGQKKIVAGLRWAEEALNASLKYCRSLPDYFEEESPNPLCVVLTTGLENTPLDEVMQSAQALKSVPFRGGQVEVVVLGIGLRREDFATAQTIASDPAGVIKFDPNVVLERLASVRY
jgi:hypothetical protein